MSGSSDHSIGKTFRLGAFVLAAGLLVACDTFDPRVEGALDQYSAQEIFERGEFELESGDGADAAVGVRGGGGYGRGAARRGRRAGPARGAAR